MSNVSLSAIVFSHLNHSERCLTARYRIGVSHSGPHLFHLTHGSSWIGVVEAHSLADGGLLIRYGGGFNKNSDCLQQSLRC
jgi:hypothetical protein